MATSPYSEDIMDALETAIKAVSKQSGDNHTVESVIRYDRFTSDDGLRPSVTIGILGENTIDGAELQHATATLEVLILARIDSSDQSIGTDKSVNLFAHDVRLAVHGVDWDALNAFINRIEMRTLVDDPDDPSDGFSMRLFIEYETLKTSGRLV